MALKEILATAWASCTVALPSERNHATVRESK